MPDEWDDEYRWWPENWLGGPPAEDQTAGGDGEARPVAAPPDYDWTTSKSFARYKTMSDALLATNRTIEYSQCAWGHAHIEEWGNSTGHSWRMWGDIFPEWFSKHQVSLRYDDAWKAVSVSFFYLARRTLTLYSYLSSILGGSRLSSTTCV